MSQTTTLSTVPHTVERWAEDTHWCPTCRSILLNWEVYAAAIREGMPSGLTGRLILEGTIDAAISHGYHPARIGVVTPKAWGAMAETGACPHNAALSGGVKEHSGGL